MRRHGWELPYHPLQVVAVAMFLALVFAFYVFVAPFVGSKIFELLTIAVYSPAVIIVFALYVWCVATNPVDIGILNSKKRHAYLRTKNKPASSMTPSRVDRKENLPTASPMAHVGPNDSSMPESPNASLPWVLLLARTLVGRFCRRVPSTAAPNIEDSMLYCTLCKVEVFKNSKHCRICDKCVDGFDHHCRWLNNCVGQKNYKGFIGLMVSGITTLVLQWSLGIWVLVHYFLNSRLFRSIIVLKLGSSFSSVAYIVVVAFCTLLAMAATYPLAQLFCFHVLLIKKGISTYDYIAAMREQEQRGGAESAQSPLTSPASSAATMNSGASSAGALQMRAWCTPPRIFFEQEEGVYRPESSLSVDMIPSNSRKASTQGNLKRKASVNISPWALASLNREEALRAGTLARKKSSVLQSMAPISEKSIVAETDSSLDSSREISAEFLNSIGYRGTSRKQTEANLNFQDVSLVLTSWQNGKLPLDSLEQMDSSENDSGNLNPHSETGKKVLNPLQMEARKVFKSSHAFSAGGITVSSPENNGAPSEAWHSNV